MSPAGNEDAWAGRASQLSVVARNVESGN